MHAHRSDEHRAHDHGSTKGCDQPDGEEQAAACLRHAGHPGHLPARPVADLLEHRPGAVQAMPLVPAEELLRAVREQQQAEDGPDDEQPLGHDSSKQVGVCNPRRHARQRRR